MRVPSECSHLSAVGEGTRVDPQPVQVGLLNVKTVHCHLVAVWVYMYKHVHVYRYCVCRMAVE